MRRHFGRKGNASQVSPLISSRKDGALPDFGLVAGDPKDNAKAHQNARNSAIRLLARREHAKAEIKQKLKFRGFDDEIATDVVDELTLQRLLCDERFAEVFIRARAERGQGPVRLRAELRQLKLPPEMVESRIKAAQVDWARLAREIRLRKFGQEIPKVATERAKQMRFLQYRGFTADHIRRAMGTSFEEDHLLDAMEDDLADDGQPK